MIPSLDARLALREVGIQLSEDAMASRALRDHPEILAAANLVVAMTTEQTYLVRALAGDGGQVNVVTLPELAGERGDIADPAGQGEEAFRAARDEIMRCLALGFDRMVERALA